MATEKRAKKEKEIVSLFEGQIRGEFLLFLPLRLSLYKLIPFCF